MRCTRFRDPGNLNLALVKVGLVGVYRGSIITDRYQSPYVAAEATAQQVGRGMVDPRQARAEPR